MNENRDFIESINNDLISLNHIAKISIENFVIPKGHTTEECYKLIATTTWGEKLIITSSTNLEEVKERRKIIAKRLEII